MAALDAWEVEYSKNGRELRLRMKLDEAIVEYQSQKTAKKQKDQKDDAVASVPSVTCLFGSETCFISLPPASPPAIERWPQGSLMCILGGSLRERRREKKEKKKKGRRRQSHKTEAAQTTNGTHTQ